MHVIQALTHTPSICFRARFALCFGDEIIMSGLALLFPNRPVSLHFIINDQIMENELGAYSFLLFSLFLYFFILNNSLILFRIPEFYGLRLACLQIYLMKTPQSFSCFHSIALNRQQKNIFNGWSHHRISASYWKS